MSLAGRRIVAIGGGHGLAATLRALRRLDAEPTAIVTVADDGGSTGRLRTTMALPAAGDLRRCIAALADPESLWGSAIEHRFSGGDLDDHALGNIVLYGLTELTGDFLAAVDEVQRLAGCRGRVLPATCEPVQLSATLLEGGRTVSGQVAVATTGPVDRLRLHPEDPAAPKSAVSAISDAEIVVLGPGSLFTSVLAAATVPAISDALNSTSAHRVWIANLREQRHETTGFDLADHVAALSRHGIVVDCVLADPGGLVPGHLEAPVVWAPLAGPRGSVHDELQLATALADLVG